MRRVSILIGILSSFLIFATRGIGQTPTQKHPGTAPRNGKSGSWIEDKVSVRIEQPFLSTNGYLILVYTITNQSGQDIQIDFNRLSLAPTQVFLRLKNPDSYLQQDPKDDFLKFLTTSLPSGLPVSLRIAVGSRLPDLSSWFSKESDEDRLWKAISEKVGNVISIDIFIPDRRIRFKLAIPRRK